MSTHDHCKADPRFAWLLPGSRVRFPLTLVNGTQEERDAAIARHGLAPGAVYTVEKSEICGWSSAVWLAGVSNPIGGFNSVLFAECSTGGGRPE